MRPSLPSSAARCLGPDLTIRGLAGARAGGCGWGGGGGRGQAGRQADGSVSEGAGKFVVLSEARHPHRRSRSTCGPLFASQARSGGTAMGRGDRPDKEGGVGENLEAAHVADLQ